MKRKRKALIYIAGIILIIAAIMAAVKHWIIK